MNERFHREDTGQAPEPGRTQPGNVRQQAPAKIAVVDDHATVALGIASLLESCDDLELVASTATVPALLDGPSRPDLVVLDLRLSDGSTLTGNVELLLNAGIGVLAYTSGESPRLVREGARAGIVGMIRKSEDPCVLVAGIRAALRGEVVASIDWAAAIDGDPEARRTPLTPRETEVLALYASGEKAERVARLLGISHDTVLDHVQNIRAKYTRANRPAPTKIHLYRRAVEDGILPWPG